MGLAMYFDKAALGASQILQGYNREDFETRVMSVTIEIAFDTKAVTSPEGMATLDLLIRLLARFYPKLKISPLDSASCAYAEELKQLAIRINRFIEFSEDESLAVIVVGKTPITKEKNCFYVGSEEWTVHFSPINTVPIGNSNNPFGAGAAACFAVSNVFRAVFGDQLSNGHLDTDFSLSLLNFELTTSAEKIPIDGLKLSFNETFIVGVGAIGNGAVWALSRLQKLEGSIYLVDHEKVERSNLQRYVLTTENDEGHQKTSLYQRFTNSKVFIPYQGTWSDFLSVRQNWNLPLVALALDTSADRIAAQASLPKQIINAWTQPDDLGISRHNDFLKDACISCLYPAKSGGLTRAQLIAGSLGLLHRELEIRTLIHNDSSLDESWIKTIAVAKEIDFETLKPFIGLPISQFYSKVLCGGLITTNAKNQLTETPMAFQSALAGILLASELVLKITGIRTSEISALTRINLLKPITRYMNEPLLKVTHRDCICQDDDFKKQYRAKYCSV
ncbi:ThiF family protein [Lacibacter cauensis]|uniref:ThiF family protein n=1 Tax=Lacibacter cauensis TaxID=510947 RepID=A0A562S9B4_9BACT|nr:E2 ligase fold family C protein [Lacibacter cauensis]TWI77952.1 ThiF family protein [Lacibacter cauensis]